MANSKPVATPTAVGASLRRHDGDPGDYPYAQAVGSLNYLTTATRPDLAPAVGVVSRYSSYPGPEHVAAVKRIFRYLRGTPDLGIRYGGDAMALIGFVDADFAGDADDSKSTTGFAFTLNGGPVSWGS